MPEKNDNLIRTVVTSKMPMHRHFLFLLLAALLVLGVPDSSRAEDSPDNTARQMKAAHLLKFAHYIEWPVQAFADPADPIVIGVIGAAPLAEELERISPAHEIGKRKVVVKRLTTEDTSAKVHILYIGRRSGPKVQEWFTTVETQPLLRVCDASHELAHACAIKFLMHDNRLRFDISLPATEASGIRITAPLLTVARQVEE